MVCLPYRNKDLIIWPTNVSGYPVVQDAGRDAKGVQDEYDEQVQQGYVDDINLHGFHQFPKLEAHQ